ncbi:Maleylacetate reductase (plasmid) [Variovorax sp. SRS16]|uniref:iron-containing alcohol dehydrogenase n=1 Tax=Variovorax sp. SRS16 TaxID=282217 RepID=UPI0013163E52|nr:Maleylacetate reductase [Variovorax sp. SRS16]
MDNFLYTEVHTVLLPHALRYNAKAAPEAMARIAKALVVTDAPTGIFELAKAHGAPVSLAAIGMAANGLDQAAELAVSNQYPNPRPLERMALRDLLGRAFEGVGP